MPDSMISLCHQRHWLVLCYEAAASDKSPRGTSMTSFAAKSNHA